MANSPLWTGRSGVVFICLIFLSVVTGASRSRAADSIEDVAALYGSGAYLEAAENAEAIGSADCVCICRALAHGPPP